MRQLDYCPSNILRYFFIKNMVIFSWYLPHHKINYAWVGSYQGERLGQ